jgi:hypothetical protein
MNSEQAKEIVDASAEYISFDDAEWMIGTYSDRINVTLDGTFDVEDLEAILISLRDLQDRRAKQ